MVWYWFENIRLQCFKVLTSWDNGCLTEVTLFRNEVFKLFSYVTQNWKRKYRSRKFRFLFLPAICHVDYLLNRLNSGLVTKKSTYSFGFGKFIFTFDCFLWWNSSFWQINISCMRKMWKHYFCPIINKSLWQFSQLYCCVGIPTLIPYFKFYQQKTA